MKRCLCLWLFILAGGVSGVSFAGSATQFTFLTNFHSDYTLLSAKADSEKTLTNINQLDMPYAYNWSSYRYGRGSAGMLTNNKLSQSIHPLTPPPQLLLPERQRSWSDSVNINIDTPYLLFPYPHGLLTDNDFFNLQCCKDSQVQYSIGYRDPVELDRYTFEALRREKNRVLRHLHH